MSKFSLNENQQKAVAHIDGPIIVLAGPGSGKTAVITARAAHLLSVGIPAHNILIITYSKAAALEMEGRFKQLYADGDVPPVAFGTFHSTFFRMLRRKKNFNLEQIFGEGEKRSLVKDFLVELGYDIDDEFLSSVLNEMSLVRNELHDIAHYHSTTVSAEHFHDLLRQYDNYKAKYNKIDFDDMLCLTYEMLKSEQGELDYWRKKYTHIMIDEFQDINTVQYETVRLVAMPKNNLFIVGDDDQSIYRFRGARPEFLLNFPNDYPNVAQIVLSTNYRSTNDIIAVSNKVISANSMRYNKEIVGTGRKGAAPKILTSDDQNHEALQIAEMIRSYIKKGVDLDEIVVAFRLHIQARALTDIFLNMNIPFKTRDEIPTIYDHWISEDLIAYLRLAKRLSLRQKIAYDPDAVRVANKPFRYISKSFLHGLKKDNMDMFRAYSYSDMLHATTKGHIEDLHRYMLTTAKRDTADAIKYIRKTIGYDEYILQTCEFRKLRPAGLLEIADELQDAAKEHPSFDDFIAHAAQSSALAKQNQNPTGPCVTLSTLHSVKGLEFEKVFIVGVIEDLLPSARSKTLAEIEEERRLFYVGVTRAKKELYVSTLKTRYDKQTDPSRFLDEF